MVERPGTNSEHPVTVVTITGVVRRVSRVIGVMTVARVLRVAVGAVIACITRRAILVVGLATSRGATVVT